MTPTALSWPAEIERAWPKTGSDASTRSVPKAGKKTPKYLAYPTASAARVPVWMTVNNVQPYRKPVRSPYASRRKTYWPPARGRAAPSSA